MIKNNIILAVVTTILVILALSLIIIFATTDVQENNSHLNEDSPEEIEILYQDKNPIFTSAFFKNVESSYTATSINRIIGTIYGGELISLCAHLSALTLNEYTPPEDADIICGGNYYFVLNFENGEKAEFWIQGNVITVEASISGFEDLVGKQYEAINGNKNLVDIVMSHFRTEDIE